MLTGVPIFRITNHSCCARFSSKRLPAWFLSSFAPGVVNYYARNDPLVKLDRRAAELMKLTNNTKFQEVMLEPFKYSLVVFCGCSCDQHVRSLDSACTHASDDGSGVPRLRP